MMEVGLRVVRGPDWKWENQDDGEGHVGTVVEIGRRGSASTPEDTVVVQWDTGNRTNYRTGFNDKYDLRIFDTAPIGIRHPNISCSSCLKHGIAGMRWKCTVCPNFDLCSHCYHNDKHELSHPFLRFDITSSVGVPLPKRSSKSSVKITAKGIFVGARVTRGYDWDWGNQDGGEGKVGKVIDIRGWDNESRRSVANVMWSSGSTNVYRLGHKGKVDLKCMQSAEGGKYYRDHLPILRQQLPTSTSTAQQTSSSLSTVTPVMAIPGPSSASLSTDQTSPLLSTAAPSNTSSNSSDHAIMIPASGSVTNNNSSSNKSQSIQSHVVDSPNRVSSSSTANPSVVDGAACSTPSTSTAFPPRSFTIGEKVKVIIEDEQELKALQEGHGGWNPRMARFLGKIGTVHRMTEHGDVRVKFPDSQLRWTFNPASLLPLPNFQTGDCVRVIDDAERVRALQINHGEWIDQMRSAIGARGKVVKVYLDNDLRVQMESGTTWTFNPLCVTLVSSATSTGEEATQQQSTTETVAPVNEDLLTPSTQLESINSLSHAPSSLLPHPAPHHPSIHSSSHHHSLPPVSSEVSALSEFVRDMSLSGVPPSSIGPQQFVGGQTSAKGQQRSRGDKKSSSRAAHAILSSSHNNGTPSSSSQPPQDQETIEKLKYLESKITEIEEAFCCGICMERVKNVVFLCGHSACVICAQNLAQCHMCREPITRRINIY